MSKRSTRANILAKKVQRICASSVIEEVTVSPYFVNTDEKGNDDLDGNEESTEDTKADTVSSHSSSPLQPYAATKAARRLTETFFNQECVTLAKSLLGQVLVRIVDGVRVSGTIVETESYLGGDDVASHSHNGKRTPRNEPMYMKPGSAYVYSIYGMYYCFNISSKGDGACVLVRALEPIEGLPQMSIGRNKRRKSATPLKNHQLCNGPSKLCLALNMTKDSCNKLDMSTSNTLWLEAGSSIPADQIEVDKRIGIESAGEEWANKPLRFYIKGVKCVSVFKKQTTAAT